MTFLEKLDKICFGEGIVDKMDIFLMLIALLFFKFSES
jgi:hypothetical protein